MTLKGLLVFFEDFYNEKYSGLFLESMIGYLNGFSENFYKSCAEVIPKRFSRIYNKVPDPSIIEKHIDEIRGNMPKPKAIEEPVPEISEEEKQARERGREELRAFFDRKAREEEERKKNGDFVEKPMAKILGEALRG